MSNFCKCTLLIVGALVASIGGVWADFNQGILDQAMKMAEADYKIEANPVNKAVQAANFLVFDLKRESDPVKAKNIADTLFGLVNEGRGVGGISKTPANKSERPLMEGALEAVAHFLKDQQNLVAGERPLAANDLDEKLKPLLPLSQDYEIQHLGAVRNIVLRALGAGGNVYNVALQRQIEQRMKDEVAAFGRELDTLKGANDPLKKSNSKDILDFLTEKSKSIVVPMALTQAAIDQTADLAAKQDALINLTKILKETVIPQRAFHSAEAIRRILKTIDFSDPKRLPAEVIDALIAVEKYRMFEAKQGGLEETDVTVFDYQGTTQSPQSEAVLLAMVSAIQNYLDHEARMPEDLIRLFKYDMNSRKLVNGDVRVAAKGMLEQKIIDQIIDQIIITPQLLQAVDTAQLNIRAVQKLAADADGMKQFAMFYGIPKFNLGTLQQEKNPRPKFILYYESSGSGLQCGFFSLGFSSRQDAINQILDNLCEPEIFAMADATVSCSSEIKSAMSAWLKFNGKGREEIANSLVEEKLPIAEKQLKESRREALRVDEKERSAYQKEMAVLSDKDIQRKVEDEKSKLKKSQNEVAGKLCDNLDLYIKLYAKKKDVDLKILSKADAEKFYRELYHLCESLIQKIKQEEAAIDEEIDQEKRTRGIVSAADVAANASTVSYLNAVSERKKWQVRSKLVQLIYSKEDFQSLVEKSISEKFRAGELEFDPNPDWSLRTPSYPQIIAELNNYNIYAWVTKSQFDAMQRAPNAHIANPVYETSDGQYVLVQYLPGDERAKPIYLLNKSGGHFEKWIDADDYPRLARAIRHKQLHRVGDTRR